MDRHMSFLPKNYYHIYNRGVNKQKIFYVDNDYKSFQKQLYIRNSIKHFDSNRIKDKSLQEIDRNDSIVDIIAYALMPNHFHLLIHEKVEGGISNFMKKLGTAHAMYMNTKYQRSGPLMCRPFRSKHVDSDTYLRWVLNYIHVNPCELNHVQKIENLRQYPYSSFTDYYCGSRPESLVITPEALPYSVSEIDNLKELKQVFSNLNVGGVSSNIQD